jgi:spore coat polysaccharide biosynthesis protein SpsF (cytidylyltransferase family)
MNLALLQARMGSTRLPGKVLKEINGIPLIQILINRVSQAKCIDKIAVVTSTNVEDDELENYCIQNNILVFRGSDWDVLDRFYSAAKFFGAQEGGNIIRLTSDCPTHHGSTVDWVYEQFVKFGVDLFSNSNEDPIFLEDGFDVEVVKFYSKWCWPLK